MEDTFLGFGSVFWQFVNGAFSTIFIGICMGIISIKWLNKRELLNAEEGELLNKRVDSYMQLLDFMAGLENKKVIMDPKHKLKDEIDPEHLFIRRDRPAVEYWPMLEDFDMFMEYFHKLDEYYKFHLSLMDPAAAKELIFTYGMFSRIYDYYVYLCTIKLNDEVLLTQDEAKAILAIFYPKLGMILDVDFTKMQADLEKKLVKGVYQLKFQKNKKWFSEEVCKKYFLKRYQKTDFILLEYGLFTILVQDICEFKKIDKSKAKEMFLPNEFVQTHPWDDEEIGIKKYA